MTPEFVVALAKSAMETTLLICAPMLGTGLAVGLLVSIFQAVTSIQDMSLTFIPKILVVSTTLLLVLPWIMGIMIAFTSEVFINFPEYIR